MASFYCVKCRASKNVSDSEVKHTTLRNGRPAITAKCPDCGTKMVRIVSG